MRIVALLFVILGVVLAGGAIYYGQQYMANLEAMMAAKNADGPKTVKVLVASVRLEYGHRMTRDSATKTTRFVQWPQAAAPEGAFTENDFMELAGEGDNEHRVVLRTIEPGEPILRSKLSGYGASSRVATRVSEGMRAFTIPINAISGVAGLIAPGDRVDILLTRTINRELTTSIILQNVFVIATDQLSNTETSRTRVARSATVEVNPTDAQKLALAQQVGRLSLTLRGMGEPTGEETAPIQIKDLPDQPEQIAPQQVEQGTSVRVRKGGQVQEIEVD